MSHNATNVTEYESVPLAIKTSNGFSSNGTETTESMDLQDTINHIQIFVSPILLLVGVTGNACIVVTVLHRQFRQITTRFFLCALAFSDSLVILTTPFNQNFMVTLGEKDPRALSDIGCKLFFLVYRTGKISSSWFIVAIAVERFIAVIFPLHVKRLIQKKNVMLVIGCVYLIVTLINLFWSFSTGIKQICLPDLVPEGGLQRHKIHIILAATMYTFLPFTILICITPPIIIKLVSQSRKRKTLVQGIGDRSIQDTSRISLMLAVVVTCWTIFIMPITVVLIHTLWTNEPILGSMKKGLFLLQAVAQFFEQINHSCNFLIYVLCSSQFRKRFCRILKQVCGGCPLLTKRVSRKQPSVASMMKTSTEKYMSGNQTLLLDVLPARQDNETARLETEAIEMHGYDRN